MNILEKIDKYLEEKTLEDKDIKKMIKVIWDKTANKNDNGSIDINDLVSGIEDEFDKNGSLSPKQVGWLMKTMKALSGK